MILTSTLQIQAPPETLWRLLVSPASLQSWNRNIGVIVPVSPGDLREGSRIRLRYSLRGKESNYLAEVLEYEEPKRLVFHLTGGNLPIRGYIQEIYELKSDADGTFLQQFIVLENTGLASLSLLVMKAGHIFKGLAGRKNLSALKDRAENQG